VLYAIVCLSITRVDQSKTVEVRIMKFSPHSSYIPLVFAGKFRSEFLTNFPEPNKGEVGNKPFSSFKHQYLENSIRLKLLLMTNRMSHVCFRLTPKLMTVDYIGLS